MPKNTLKFWKNLRREKLNNTNCLKSLRFAIFGLGDSSYIKCVHPLRRLSFKTTAALFRSSGVATKHFMPRFACGVHG
jgi:sulfite reductase alpha subunit-like flavoprotein